jgi:hypothetical protein
MRRMTELRASGLSLRAIAEEMTAAGIPISHVGVQKAISAASRPEAA